MHIGDIINVKDQSGEEALSYWKGKVIEIRDSGRIITVQDKGINFAEIDVDDLMFKDGEYWEK